MVSKPWFTPILDTPLLVLGDEDRTLVACDLHLGFEGQMAHEGIYLPFRREDPAELLLRAVSLSSSRRLVLLGDVKHRVTGPSPAEAFDLKGFFRALVAAAGRVDVCPGNHDGGLMAAASEGVAFHDPRGFVLGGAGFFHGHTWPDAALLDCRVIFMGHSHPTVWFVEPLRDRNVEPCWLRATIRARQVFDRGVEGGIYDAKAKKSPKKPPSAEAAVGSSGAAEGATGRTAAQKRPLDSTAQKRPTASRRIELVVVPALSPFGSGCAVNDPERPVLGPLGKAGLLDMAASEVYLLNGVHLGKASSLPNARGMSPGAASMDDEGAGNEEADDEDEGDEGDAMSGGARGGRVGHGNTSEGCGGGGDGA